MKKQELAREFEKWAIDKYGVRIKETDIKWWEERQEIWNACYELMNSKIEEYNKIISDLECSLMDNIEVARCIEERLDKVKDIIKRHTWKDSSACIQIVDELEELLKENQDCDCSFCQEDRGKPKETTCHADPNCKYCGRCDKEESAQGLLDDDDPRVWEDWNKKGEE